MFLHNSDKIALKLKEQQISYSDLHKKVNHYASLFSKNCQRVVIFSENRLEWVYSFYASWQNDCTVVPVDYLSTAEEISYIVEDSVPEIFFCSREREPLLREVVASLDYTPQILVFEDIEEAGTAQDATLRPNTTHTPNLKATCLIIYTSGTTGTPKGVMLSYENILANIDAVSQGVKIFSADERVMLLLPLHHIFPLIGSMAAPLYVGATVAICPSLQSEEIINTLQENKITILSEYVS